MTNVEEIKELIDESPFSEEDKIQLRQQLEREGLSESFLKNMNHFLIKDLQERTGKYEQTMVSFDNAYKKVEKEYRSKRGVIDDELEKKIAEIDSKDTKAKEKIFDQYYKDVDTIQANYEKQAKETFSKVFSSAMLEAL